VSHDVAKLNLFVAHRPQLVDYAARILGDPSRAEDVVQDAWLKLAEAPLGNDIRQPVSYLFRLVRNVAIDRARRLALEIRYGAKEELPLAMPSAEPSPEQDAITRDMVRMLEQVLAELPDRTRLVFEMNRIGGSSVDEIAAMLDVSPSFAYRLLREATVHCAKKLHAAGWDRPS
jgi:RNA polymerase sigma-70 factor (ECF subfamily)